MRSVGLETLKNKLSEYVRLAASGETVLITDRDRVVAEVGPPSPARSSMLSDALLLRAFRQGWLTPPVSVGRGPPARKPVMTIDELLGDLQRDRADRRSISIAPWRSHICWSKIGFPRMSSGKTNWYPADFLNAKFGIVSTRTAFRIRTAARNLIGRIAIIETVGPVLIRALQPFPVPVRTPDTIHLAAIEFVRAQKQSVQLASCDERLLTAARLFGITEWCADR